MITSNNQFSIGLDGSHQAPEPVQTPFLRSSEFRRAEGASLIRGR